MLSRFFIDRPVFAWVIAILIMLAGALSITSLPIAQYPSIAPPTITVIATYPGASAKTLEDTVTQVIEQRLNGIDNLRYIEVRRAPRMARRRSRSPSKAAPIRTPRRCRCRTRSPLATPLLPQEVQQQGVQVNKSVRNFLIVVGLISEDGSMSGTDLADYNSSAMQDPISRLPGVGEIQTFGTQYAMRIWLDPDKLTKYQLATVGCGHRGPGAECPGLRGRARRPAVAAGPAAECHDHGAEPAANAGAIRRHPAARRARMARASSCATSRGSNSAARATTSSRASTASRRAAWRSGRPRAPMRSKPWTR